MLRRFAKIAAGSVRTGNFISFNNKNCLVVRIHRVVQGRNATFYRIELKNLKDNSLLTDRLEHDQSVELIDFEARHTKYLYHTDSEVVVVDENMDEHYIPASVFPFFENAAKLFTEQMSIAVNFADGHPIFAKISVPRIVLKIDEGWGNPARGSKSTGTSHKTVMVRGMLVEVPEFLNPGDTASFMFGPDYKLTYTRREK